jgi:hypothetical protein
MLRRIGRRLLPAAFLVILAVPVSGVAYAYWGGSGSGAGSATTGAAQLVTLSPGVAGVKLYPGGQTNVPLTVANPNAFSVHIGSLALDTRGIVVTGGSGCTVDLAKLTLSGLTNNGIGWTLPANNSSVTLTMVMGTDAANACQNASFTIYLKAGL